MRALLLAGSAVTALVVLGASATANGVSETHAAGSQSPHAPRAESKAALPHYKVHTFAPDKDLSSTYGIVSGNGTFFANNYTNTIVYNTRTGKRVGKIAAPSSAIDNSGDVVGTALSDGTKLTPLGNETAYLWHSGHIRFVKPVGSIAKCGGPSNETTGFNWISPAARIVGYEGWSCNGTPYQVAVGDGTGPKDKLHTIGQNGGTTTDPTQAFYVTDGGIQVGSAEAGVVEWQGTNPPVALTTLYRRPNLEASTTGRYWDSAGDFLGFHGDNKGGIEYIAGGHVADVAPASSTFTAQAVGRNVVVGYKGSGGVAEIWTPASGLRTLKSLSTAPGIYPTTAVAVDGAGDIFGVASTKGGLYYYEAELEDSGPTVTITGPKDGHTYVKGSTIKASYRCKAAPGQKLRSCKGPVADHATISSAKVAKHHFTVTAVDTNGSTTTKRVHYSIRS